MFHPKSNICGINYRNVINISPSHILVVHIFYMALTFHVHQYYYKRARGFKQNLKQSEQNEPDQSEQNEPVVGVQLLVCSLKRILALNCLLVDSGVFLQWMDSVMSYD